MENEMAVVTGSSISMNACERTETAESDRYSPSASNAMAVCKSLD